MENSAKRVVTVLIVEDDALLRMNSADHLREEGFAVLEAGSGEAAIELLHVAKEIDLVFTDIRLGGQINGWDVADAFRSRYPDIPVLYTSGNSISPPRNVERSWFFATPYRLQELAAVCRSFCDGTPS